MVAGTERPPVQSPFSVRTPHLDRTSRITGGFRSTQSDLGQCDRTLEDPKSTTRSNSGNDMHQAPAPAFDISWRSDISS